MYTGPRTIKKASRFERQGFAVHWGVVHGLDLSNGEIDVIPRVGELWELTFLYVVTEDSVPLT